jgi:hypothetical protein
VGSGSYLLWPLLAAFEYEDPPGSHSRIRDMQVNGNKRFGLPIRSLLHTNLRYFCISRSSGGRLCRRLKVIYVINYRQGFVICSPAPLKFHSAPSTLLPRLHRPFASPSRLALRYLSEVVVGTMLSESPHLHKVAHFEKHQEDKTDKQRLKKKAPLLLTCSLSQDFQAATYLFGKL